MAKNKVKNSSARKADKKKKRNKSLQQRNKHIIRANKHRDTEALMNQIKQNGLLQTALDNPGLNKTAEEVNVAELVMETVPKIAAIHCTLSAWEELVRCGRIKLSEVDAIFLPAVIDEFDENSVKLAEDFDAYLKLEEHKTEEPNVTDVEETEEGLFEVETDTPEEILKVSILERLTNMFIGDISDLFAKFDEHRIVIDEFIDEHTLDSETKSDYVVRIHKERLNRIYPIYATPLIKEEA